MSQYLLPTIDPSVNTGSQLSAWLNLWAQAVQTQQIGASRPVGAQMGLIWIKDVSPVLQQLMLFDGADDLVLLQWNPSTNVVSYPGAVKGPASSDIYNIALWGGDLGDTLLDSGYEIQSSVTDVAANKVMRVGAFGLGADAISIADFNTVNGNGFFRAGPEALNPPVASSYWTVLQQRYDTNGASQIAQAFSGGAIYKRVFSGGWSAWVQIWTTGNLVKQTSDYDVTAGAMLAVGAFGWGRQNMPFSPIPGNDLNNVVTPGFYHINSVDVAGTPYSQNGMLISLAISSAYGGQLFLTLNGELFTRGLLTGAWSAWKAVAFTAGSAFTGTTQFESMQASGTIKSAGGHVSGSDIEAFTATQLSAQGDPLPPTFLLDLQAQVQSLTDLVATLQAQVEALQP